MLYNILFRVDSFVLQNSHLIQLNKTLWLFWLQSYMKMQFLGLFCFSDIFMILLLHFDDLF